MKDLVLYHDDNSVFADYSLDARDYLRDEFTVNYTAAEDYIYLGLYKPFNKIYIEFKAPAVGNVNLSAQYWNGTSFTSLEITDDSKGFTRSGFVSFEKPEDWASTAVNSDDKFYIRFSADP